MGGFSGPTLSQISEHRPCDIQMYNPVPDKSSIPPVKDAVFTVLAGLP